MSMPRGLWHRPLVECSVRKLSFCIHLLSKANSRQNHKTLNSQVTLQPLVWLNSCIISYLTPLITLTLSSLKDGYVFRIMIGYLKEISLLKMVTLSSGATKSTDNEQAAILEQELVTLPKINTMLIRYICMYTSTVQLPVLWDLENKTMFMFPGCPQTFDEKNIGL